MKLLITNLLSLVIVFFGIVFSYNTVQTVKKQETIPKAVSNKIDSTEVVVSIIDKWSLNHNRFQNFVTKSLDKTATEFKENKELVNELKAELLVEKQKEPVIIEKVIKDTVFVTDTLLVNKKRKRILGVFR